VTVDNLALLVLLVIAAGWANATSKGQGKAWLVNKFTNASAPAPASITGGTPTSTGQAAAGNGTGSIALRSVYGAQLAEPFAGRVEAAIKAADADGVRIRPQGGGGYRWNQRQLELRREHGCGNGREYDPKCIGNPPTALPGDSRHEKGLAVDFADMTSHSSPGWQWLNTHGGEFGLHNLASEPWHWSVDGH